MKNLCYSLSALIMLTVGSASHAEAQRGGGGGVLDWIHKLSGPAFQSTGYAVWLWPIQTRADAIYRSGEVRDEDVQELRRVRWLAKGSLGFDFGQSWGHSTDLKGALGEPDSLRISTITVGANYLIARQQLFAFGLRGAIGFHQFKAPDGQSSNQSYTIHLVLDALPDLPIVKSGFVLYPSIRVASGVSSFGAFATDPFGSIDADVSIDSREWAWTSVLQVGVVFVL